MNRPQSTLRLRLAGARKSKFAVLVGLVVGVMVFAPSALTQLGSLRAAQAETNERAEYETNERAHVSSNYVRCSRNKGSLLSKRGLNAESLDSASAPRRATATNRLRVPPIVDWSSTMRC